MIRSSSDCKSRTRGGILFLLLFATCHIAFALDPDRSIAQFYHTAWTIEDGAPTGAHVLAQTKDGYLWLAAESGLFRFDGVRFERYQPERGDPIPSQDIAALLATPDGGLWIGFRPYGATFLKNGRGHSYGEREGLPLSTITEFAMDREGAVWASTTHGLFRFANSRWEKIGTEWGFFSERAQSLFLDNQGKLWVNGFTDLYCLSPGAHVFQRRKVPHDWRMKQAPDGTLWMWREIREYERSTAHWRSFTTDPRQRLGRDSFWLWWIGMAGFGCRPNVRRRDCAALRTRKDCQTRLSTRPAALFRHLRTKTA